MPDRRPLRFACLAAALPLAAVLAGCPSEQPTMTCAVKSFSLPGNALTLLSDVRMDRIVDGFMLFGTDGSTVSWAALSQDGQLGDVHSYPVPDHAAGPWFAAAGTAAPGDH